MMKNSFFVEAPRFNYKSFELYAAMVKIESEASTMDQKRVDRI